MSYAPRLNGFAEKQWPYMLDISDSMVWLILPVSEMLQHRDIEVPLPDKE